MYLSSNEYHGMAMLNNPVAHLKDKFHEPPSSLDHHLPRAQKKWKGEMNQESIYL